MNADDRPVIQVPGNLVVEDRIAGSLTFRHLAYLAVAGGGIALALLGGGIAARIAGVLVGLLGTAGALLRPSGRPLDSWVLPLVRYWRRPRARPEAVPVAQAADAVEEKPEPLAPSQSFRVPSFAAGAVAVAVGALLVAGVVRFVPASRPAPTQPRPVLVVPVLPPPDEEVDDAIDAYLDWLLHDH